MYNFPQEWQDSQVQFAPKIHGVGEIGRNVLTSTELLNPLTPDKWPTHQRRNSKMYSPLHIIRVSILIVGVTQTNYTLRIPKVLKKKKIF